MRNLKAALLVLVAFVATASTADATQRYVAPAGTGVACTQATPCPLATGVNSAMGGDEVIVTAGTYSMSTNLANSSSSLTIRGESGQPRPVINTTATSALTLNGGGTTLRDLTINQTAGVGGIAVLSADGLTDHVQVRSVGYPCQLAGTVRDTLCASTGSGDAINFNANGGTWDLKLRNVTAIASGAGRHALVYQSAGATIISVDARNVIAQGGTSPGADVRAETTGGVSAATSVTLQDSNYDTVSSTGPGTETVTAAGSGTNQTAAPIFADTTDYLQAAGSPTIDAGATDGFTGTTTDLGGQPRIQGSAIDIGADEFQPAVTPPADTTPPETTIDKGPKKKGKSKKATFTFSSSEAGSTFVCKIDGKAEAPCTSPLKLKRLKKGKHKLSVVATDAAGNADATAASYSWKVKKKRKKPKG